MAVQKNAFSPDRQQNKCESFVMWNIVAYLSGHALTSCPSERSTRTGNRR